MRPQKVEDTVMMDGFLSVFRSKGYDGASLAELASVTGLKKASLYYRFPNGKKEMTTALLSHLEIWVDKNISRVLIDEEKDPKQRLTIAIENINKIYNNGIECCIYRSLSMDTGIDLFGQKLRSGIQQWLDAFMALGIAVNMDKEKAKENAEQTFIEIQGSLVLAKSMNTIAPFQEAMKRIWKRYVD